MYYQQNIQCCWLPDDLLLTVSVMVGLIWDLQLPLMMLKLTPDIIHHRLGWHMKYLSHELNTTF